MDNWALVQSLLVVGGALFGLGVIGFVVRRNMIVMFLSAEMMLQGISLSLVAWSRWHGDWGGQTLVLFVIAIAACEAAVGLALVLALFRYSGRLDIAFWQDLREEGRPAFVDRKVPEEVIEPRRWPSLVPAGVRPTIDEDELVHRSRV